MESLTCQIGYYPLRAQELDPQVEEVLEIIRSYEVEVKVTEMAALVRGEAKVIYPMLRQLTEAMQSKGNEFILNITVSTSCGWTEGQSGS